MIFSAYRVCAFVGTSGSNDRSMSYTSREDSLFWLVKDHGLIVMISSVLGDRLLSLTALELVE